MTTIWSSSPLPIAFLIIAAIALSGVNSLTIAMDPPPPLPQHAAAFRIRRNVKDYGAIGDGVHDDTDAFIVALTEGKATSILDPNSTAWNASQYNCQTTKPSFVFIPSGTYRLSNMLPLTYYTQFVGEHDNRPVLKFYGKQYYCTDAGNDDGPGNGWYGNANQNNFYHQVRNIIFDLTDCSHCSAINWQVSQATNLVNLDFQLGDPAAQNNTGILMWSGSGGYLGDLTFNGGYQALNVGNQQFTVRNVTIVNADVAILLNWNWVWSFHDITIVNASIGFQLNAGVASVSIVDTTIIDTQIGILCMNASQIVLDGYNASVHVTKPLILNETIVIPSAADVYQYVYQRHRNGSLVHGPATFGDRPQALLFPNNSSNSNKWFGRTRPNYNTFVTANFTNWTDVTTDLQSLLNEYGGGRMPIFIPYGIYFISSTVVVPVGTRLFGEVWTRFAPIGDYFQNASNPQAVFQVGSGPSDVGVVELADFIFTIHGPAPGAQMIVWYASSPNPGDCGIWDVHFRIGGAIGTEVNDTICNPNTTMADSPSCKGAHTLIHIMPNASVYIENMWGWVADHDIDRGHSLNMYNARGLVVETTKAVWLYGTAMEHSYLFQYNLFKSANTLLSIIQTETAYMQPEFLLEDYTDYRTPSPSMTTRTDPLYGADQYHGFSIYAHQVRDTVLYGAGMYSFFYRWETDKCGWEERFCQGRISAWSTTTTANNDDEGSGLSGVRLHNYNTHGASIVVGWDLVDVHALNATNGFCQTVGLW